MSIKSRFVYEKNWEWKKERGEKERKKERKKGESVKKREIEMSV